MELKSTKPVSEMTVAGLVGIYKEAHRLRMSVSGDIRVYLTDKIGGLNVRPVYGDAAQMVKVFGTVSGKYGRSQHPVVDKESGALAATDGRVMLVCDTPSAVPEAEMLAAGFQDIAEAMWRWRTVMPNREVNEGTLASLSHIIDIPKGGAMHNAVMTFAKCARAYEWRDDGGHYFFLMVRLGDFYLSAEELADMVTAFFKLGVQSVGIYGSLEADGRPTPYAPLHLVGKGKEDHNAHGLIMPRRFVEKGDQVPPAAFVLGEEGTDGQKLAAG